MMDRETKGFSKSSSMNKDYSHGNADNIKADKKEIEVARILDPVYSETDPNKPPQAPKVLMDGAPGIGKTTLTRKACIDWAKSSTFERFDLVLLIPLREARYRKAKEFKDFFVIGDDSEIKQKAIVHVQKNDGENILLIFDGYDELSYEQREEESLFLDIIRGDKLPECSVLVTSRPYASDHLKQLPSINRHVELLGFKKEQIYTCIRQNVSKESSATDLITELEKREDIVSLCYYPLNCVITVHLFEKCGALPATMTKLFHDFVLESVKRDVKVARREVFLKRQIDAVNELDRLPQSISEQLTALESLAYKSLASDQFTFTFEDLQTCFTDCSVSLVDDPMSHCLRLITSLAKFDDSTANQYQFFHLSIQEFLAARYASKTFKNEEQIDLLRKYIKMPHFRLFLLFYAGMTKISFENAKILFSLCCKQCSTELQTISGSAKNLWPNYSHGYESSEGEINYQWKSNLFLYFLHMIFESNYFDLFDILFDCFCNKKVFSLMDSHITLFDCTLLTYFFSSINHKWEKLDLSKCLLDAHSLQIFNKTYERYIGKATGKATFKSIDISGNDPEMVFSLDLLPWLSDVEEFNFVCDASCKQHETLPDLKCLSHIPKLNILLGNSHKEQRFEVFVSDSLVRLCRPALLGDEFLLHKMKTGISELKLQNIDYKTFRCAETSFETLKKLELNNVSNFNTWLSQSKTYSLFADSKSLRTLTLHHYEFTTSSAVNLFTSLAENTCIDKLNISGYFQSQTQFDCKQVGSSLGLMISTNTRIQMLRLGQMLNDELAVFLIDALSNNASLDELDVNSNHFTIDTIQSLISVTVNHSKLSKLCVENKVLEKQNDQAWTIPSHRITAKLFCAISHIKQLKTSYASIAAAFEIPHFDMDNETLTRLFHNLQCNCFVTKLSIGNRCVTDKFVSCALAKVLTNNNIIEDLTCEISIMSCECFMVSLSKSKTLKHLSLNTYTKFNKLCLIHSLKALKQNRSIETFQLYNQRLRGGHFNDEDLKHIESELKEFLTVNSTLMEMKIHIWEDISLGLARGLMQNRGLRKLEVMFYSLTSCGIAEILLSLNSTKQQLTDLKINGVCSLTRSANSEWNLVVEKYSMLWPQLQYVLKTRKETLKFRIKSLKMETMGATYLVLTPFMDSLLAVCHHLKILDLSGHYHISSFFNHQDAIIYIGETIASVLKLSMSLEVLNLQQSWLPSGIWKYASDGLKHNTSLKILNLSKSFVTVTDVINILESLKVNQTVEDLDLSELTELRKVTGTDCDKLCQSFKDVLVSNTSIRCLNLKNSISDDIAYIIAEVLYDTRVCIHKLVLSETYFTCRTIHKFFIYLAEDRTHDTNRIQVSFSDIILCPTPHKRFSQHLVEKIVVKHTNSYSSKYKCRSSKLFCTLCYGILNHKTYIPLLHPLEELSLTGVDADMALNVFRTIAKQDSPLRLKKLSLEGDELSGDQLGLQLKSMLENNETLYQLGLGTIDEVISKSVAEGLEQNSTLQEVQFELKQLNECNVAILLNSITKNVGLVKLCISRYFMLIRSATSSWYVEPYFYNIMDLKQFIKFVCIVSQIFSKECTDSNVRGHAAESILLSLSSFKLTKFELDVETAVQLLISLLQSATCKSLNISGQNKLVLGGNKELSEAIEQLLINDTTLEELNVAGSLNNTTAGGLVAGLKRNTTLLHLSIDANLLKMKTIAELVELTPNTGLISLTIMDVFKLQKYASSRWKVESDMWLWPIFLAALCKAAPNVQLLKMLTNIHNLEEGQSPMYDSTCENFKFEIFQGRVSCIKHGFVTISSSYPRSVFIFSLVFKTLQHLQNLNLSNCDISNHICSIVHALHEAKELQGLCLSHCSIKEGEMTCIMNGLNKSGLKHLDVSSNDLSTTEQTQHNLGLAIKAMLSETTSLKVLNLKSCRVSSSLCEYIALGVQSNRTLVCLNVSSNQIKGIGVKMLLTSLERNDVLQNLDLSKTLDSQEINFGHMTLQSNKTLVALHLDNVISDDSLENLAAVLQKNSTLKLLTLDIKRNNTSVIASFLTQIQLECLNCLDMFSWTSTNLGRRVEIRSTERFSKVSEVMQSVCDKICEVVVSNNSTDNLNFSFVDSWFTKHAKSILTSLIENNQVIVLCLNFSEHSIEDRDTLSHALQLLVKKNKKLTQLYLKGCVDENIVNGLARGLAANHSLRLISVESSHLTSVCVLDLIQSVEFTNVCELEFYPTFSLRNINTRFEVCRRVEDSTDYLKFFCNAVCRVRRSPILSKILCSMKELKIDCTVDSTLVASLFRSFENNPGVIRVLDLSQAQVEMKTFGTNVCLVLENMIKKNFTLRCLKLNDTINDSMTCAIARGLLHNCTLQTIELNVMCLSDGALSELLKSLSENNLAITCRQKHLASLSFVRLLSEFQQSLNEVSDHHQSNSPLSLFSSFYPLYYGTSMQSEQLKHSHALGKVLQNLKSSCTCRLQELVIISSKHFLSNMLLKTSVENLLKSCASLKVIKFCNPVTAETINGLSCGLKGNKSLCSLIINKGNLSWRSISPLLNCLHLSSLTALEFIKECVLRREPQGTSWQLQVLGSSFSSQTSNFREICNSLTTKVDTFIQSHPDELMLVLPADNSVLTVFQNSISSGSYMVRKLDIVVCCDTVIINFEEILKSHLLKILNVDLNSFNDIFENQLMKDILMANCTNSSLSKLYISSEVVLESSEKEHHYLSEGGIQSHFEITSPWKVSIQNKHALCSFYVFLSENFGDIPSKSCLGNLALQSLTCLDLSDTDFKYNDLTCLFRVLKHKMNLTDLDLSYCRLVGVHASEMHSTLLEVLKKNTTLTRLDLTGILNDDLMKAIALVLPLSSLKSLSLNMTYTFDAVEELLNGFVSSELNQLRFTDICLLQKDKESWNIDLSDNQLQSTWQSHFKLFRSWSTLFMLVTISKRVSHLKLSLGIQVNEGCQLQVFELFFSSVFQPCRIIDKHGKDNAAIFLQSLRELHLEASHASIPMFKAIIESLKICTNIEQLNIAYDMWSKENLGNSCKELIITNKSLQILTLRGYIQDEMAYDIAGALSHNFTLQKIEISLQFVSLNKTAFVLESFHHSNSTLNCLHITEGCVIHKNEASCCNVEFTGNKYFLNKLFCASVKAQNCCNCVQKALAPNSKLDLSIDEYLTVNFLEDILAPITLQKASVSELILTRNPVDSNIISLLELSKSKLQRLELRDCEISDSGCEQIANDLASNTELKALNLNSNKFTICGVRKIFSSLTKNSVLEELDVSDDAISYIFDKFAETETPAFDDNCDPLLALLSSKCTALRNLSVTIKEEEGIIKIFKSLLHNKTLQVLNCEGSSITTSSVGEAIQQMLVCNDTLCDLNLCRCDISDEVCIIISKELAKNEQLKKLDLSVNCICDGGIMELFQLLEDNKSCLQELNLSGNWSRKVVHIDYDIYVYDLKNVLATNTQLKVLIISHCNFLFSMGFGNLLFNGLRCNSSLEKLHVSKCDFDEDTCIAFTNMLSENTSITELDKQWCYFKKRNLRDISIALNESTSLKKIMCDSVTKVAVDLYGENTRIVAVFDDENTW